MKKTFRFLILFFLIVFIFSLPFSPVKAFSNTVHLTVESGSRNGNINGSARPPFKIMPLSDVDLTLLRTLDGMITGACYYKSGGSWPEGVNPNDPYNKANGEPDHLNFVFLNANIPANAVIDNATLHIKYFVSFIIIDGIKMEIFNGDSFVDINLPVPSIIDSPGVKEPVIDITSIINTPDKANSINAHLLAYKLTPSFFDASTSIDFVGIDVTYHTASPTTSDQSIIMNVDSPQNITLSGTDPDSLPLTYSVVDNPKKGTLGEISGNQITYTPTGTIGDDNFTFKVNNGIEDSAISTVHLSINHGAITNLKITADPQTITLPNSTKLTVSEQDKFGNTIDDDNSTSINFSSDVGAVSNSTVVLSSGVATTDGTSTSLGSVNFIATNGTLSSNVSVNFNPALVLEDTPITIEPITIPPISVSNIGRGEEIIQNHHSMPVAAPAPLVKENIIPIESILPIIPPPAPIIENTIAVDSPKIVREEKPEVASLSIVQKAQPIKENISSPPNLLLASAVQGSSLFSFKNQNGILNIMKKQGILIIVLIVTLIIVGLVFFVQKGDQSDNSNNNPVVPIQSPTQTKAPIELQVSTLVQGTGVGAVNGDTVTVNYTGTLQDGTVFDSNVDPKFGHVQPLQFVLGAPGLIQGWGQGVLGMKVGEKRHLIIPSALAYGSQAKGVIPPNSTLIFDIEVTAISHK